MPAASSILSWIPLRSMWHRGSESQVTKKRKRVYKGEKNNRMFFWKIRTKPQNSTGDFRMLDFDEVWLSASKMAPVDPPLLVIMPLYASSHTKSRLVCVTNRIWQKWWYVASARLGYKRHISFCSSLLSHLLWGKPPATLRNWGSPVERQRIESSRQPRE